MVLLFTIHGLRFTAFRFLLEQREERLGIHVFGGALDDDDGLAGEVEEDAAFGRAPDAAVCVAGRERLGRVTFGGAARVGLEELARVRLGVPDALLREQHVGLPRPRVEDEAVAAPALGGLPRGLLRL